VLLIELSSGIYLGSLEKGVCQSLARLQVRLIVLKVQKGDINAVRKTI
jgi:hypothetical protein